jgi:hypothetical protein
LGRPLGNPNDGPFQKDVLKYALGLLERQEGPILADYPHDAETNDGPAAVPACPVDFSGRSENLTDKEKLLQDFQAEFNAMHSWHTIAKHQSKRTTTGISGLTPDSISRLFGDFILGNEIDLDQAELASQLRLAAEDLKAFYFEALSAQPDQPTDEKTLANWFWGTTSAGAVINEVRKRCLVYEAKEMRLAGSLLLVPRNQMHRFE